MLKMWDAMSNLNIKVNRNLKIKNKNDKIIIMHFFLVINSSKSIDHKTPLQKEDRSVEISLPRN